MPAGTPKPTWYRHDEYDYFKDDDRNDYRIVDPSKEGGASSTAKYDSETIAAYVNEKEEKEHWAFEKALDIVFISLKNNFICEGAPEKLPIATHDEVMDSMDMDTSAGFPDRCNKKIYLAHHGDKTLIAFWNELLTYWAYGPIPFKSVMNNLTKEEPRKKNKPARQINGIHILLLYVGLKLFLKFSAYYGKMWKYDGFAYGASEKGGGLWRTIERLTEPGLNWDLYSVDNVAHDSMCVTPRKMHAVFQRIASMCEWHDDPIINNIWSWVCDEGNQKVVCLTTRHLVEIWTGMASGFLGTSPLNDIINKGNVGANYFLRWTHIRLPGLWLLKTFVTYSDDMAGYFPPGFFETLYYKTTVTKVDDKYKCQFLGRTWKKLKHDLVVPVPDYVGKLMASFPYCKGSSIVDYYQKMCSLRIFWYFSDIELNGRKIRDVIDGVIKDICRKHPHVWRRYSASYKSPMEIVAYYTGAESFTMEGGGSKVRASRPDERIKILQNAMSKTGTKYALVVKKNPKTNKPTIKKVEKEVKQTLKEVKKVEKQVKRIPKVEKKPVAAIAGPGGKVFAGSKQAVSLCNWMQNPTKWFDDGLKPPGVPDEFSSTTPTVVVGQKHDLLLRMDPETDLCTLVLLPRLRRSIGISNGTFGMDQGPTIAMSSTFSAGGNLAPPQDENAVDARANGFIDGVKTYYVEKVGTDATTGAGDPVSDDNTGYTVPLLGNWNMKRDEGEFVWQMLVKENAAGEKGFYWSAPSSSTIPGIMSNNTAVGIRAVAEMYGASAGAGALTIQVWGSVSTVPTFDPTIDGLLASGQTIDDSTLVLAIGTNVNLSSYKSYYLVVAATLNGGGVQEATGVDFGMKSILLEFTNMQSIDSNASVSGTNGIFFYDNLQYKYLADIGFASHEYRTSVGDWTLQNRTPELYKGGDLAMIVVPEDDTSTIYNPVSYSEIIAKVGSYDHNLENGGHAYFKFQSNVAWQRYYQCRSKNTKAGDPVIMVQFRPPAATAGSPGPIFHLVGNVIFEIKGQLPLLQPLCQDGMLGYPGSSDELFRELEMLMKEIPVLTENDVHDVISKFMSQSWGAAKKGAQYVWDTRDAWMPIAAKVGGSLAALALQKWANLVR